MCVCVCVCVFVCVNTLIKEAGLHSSLLIGGGGSLQLTQSI